MSLSTMRFSNIHNNGIKTFGFSKRFHRPRARGIHAHIFKCYYYYQYTRTFWHAILTTKYWGIHVIAVPLSHNNLFADNIIIVGRPRHVWHCNGDDMTGRSVAVAAVVTATTMTRRWRVRGVFTNLSDRVQECIFESLNFFGLKKK